MIINKLTKKWTEGESLTGNFLLSTGIYKGQPVLFIQWPQNRSNTLTYIRKCDVADGDPILELFELGADPDYINQDQFPIELRWDYNRPKLISERYRLNI